MRARPPFVQEALSSRAFRLRRSPTNTRRPSDGAGCAATWPGNLAEKGGRLRYEALVTRAPPFAGVVGERGHEWAVNQQIRQLERFMNGGVSMLIECSQRVSGVDRGVHVARFESAEQRRQTDRLTERLATNHRSSVAGLANRIQQRLEEDVHGQHGADVKRVRRGDVASRATA